MNCILLIDDNADDNSYNQIIIEKMNIADNVHVAEDGLEALKFLSENNQEPPELILLDINMPKMNGWEFLEAYKSLNDNKDVAKNVVVLATTLTPEDSRKAAAIPGVSILNTKPLTAEMMNDILQKRLPEAGNKTGDDPDMDSRPGSK